MTDSYRLFKYLGPATLAAISITAALLSARAGAQPAPAVGKMSVPKEGHAAPDFALLDLEGRTVRLSKEFTHGPVVLVVLRGWPGYQCPFCTRQFGDYMSHAADLAATGAHVLFVYPGPPDGLKEHAEALKGTTPLPSAYRVLLDPDYSFTNAYGLRWDAPQETAYPSTFVVNTRGVVTFARTSHSHGDRVPVAEVLKALAQFKR